MKLAHLTYHHGDTTVHYTDKKQNHHKSRCQPRDITITKVVREGKELRVREKDLAKLRQAIAIDTRRGQGLPEVGIAKGLLTE